MSSTYSPIAILDPNTQIWKHKLTTYSLCPVQSLYYIAPPVCGSHKTYYMSSISSAITVLNLTTHQWKTLHRPHVPYVQRYHYIDHMSSAITTRSHHPRMEHTSLPNLSSPFSRLISTTQGWNTYYWPLVQYIDLYHYIIDPTNQKYKKQHWPHSLYVKSCRCIRSNHHMWMT